MERKTFRGHVELKADEGAPEGSFKAVFATLNVIDHDGDVTLPGAFEDGQEVRIGHWGHQIDEPPVGKGVLRSNEDEAWVDGRFFTNTSAGKEHYLTVKEMGPMQEWSYVFDVLDEGPGESEGQEVRFLKALEVYSVDPVMLGAGIATRTEMVKERKASSDTIQRIHDLAVELGAKCMVDSETVDEGKDEAEDRSASDGKAATLPSTLAARLAIELVDAGILDQEK